MSAERFGDQLRRHRQAAGITQETLAERAGVSVRAISDLERGVKQRPHPETIRMLAAALGLAAESLAAFQTSVAPRSALAPAALPSPLSALIDREDETAAVAALFRPDTGIRQVTLTGPGGVGKTRLAIQVVNELRDEFPDGVGFVGLAGLTDPGLVPGAIATALGIRDASGRAPHEALARALHDRQVLVLVDNCEHLLAAAPGLAALLGGCPGLSILATSRSPLRITGEHEYPVRPLALPPAARRHMPAELARVPAIGLFVRQARAVQPQFEVTDANAAAVAAICARVDGLPLGLELAAVRMKTLAAPDLASLLDNRLGVLTGGPRDHPARHQTMRATIGWSHDLLPPGDQVTFRRLAVFGGGATLNSAAAVAFDGDTLAALDGLTALIDQSLVQRYEGTGGEPRFMMLETIREHALEQLAASEDEAPVRGRFLAYFLNLGERGEDGLTGPDQAAWMTRLEGEYGNLRAALGWAVRRGDAPSSLRMGSALWHFWSASGRLSEGRDWLDKALALDPDDWSAARAHALLRRGNLALDLAHYPEARRLFEESKSIFESVKDDLNACGALTGLGLVQWIQGDYSAARSAHETTLSISRAHDWRRGVALALQNVGSVRLAEGDYANARAAFSSSLEIRQELEDVVGAAYSSYWRGRLDRLEGNFDDSKRWLTRAQAGFREVGDQLGAAYAVSELGSLAHDRGDNGIALAYHWAALRELEEAGDIGEVVECLEGVAVAAIALRHAQAGVMLAAATAAWRRLHGAPVPSAMRDALSKILDHAGTIIPPTTFDHLWNEGEAKTIEEAVTLAFLVSSEPA